MSRYVECAQSLSFSLKGFLAPYKSLFFVCYAFGKVAPPPNPPGPPQVDPKKNLHLPSSFCLAPKKRASITGHLGAGRDSHARFASGPACTEPPCRWIDRPS